MGLKKLIAPLQVASLEVLVQAPPPVIKVETCLLPSGQLLNYSSSSSSYAGEECREAIVLIAAVDTLDPASLQFSPTPIYFTLDGTAPSNLATDPPPIPAGYGIVRVRLGKSAQVTAVAARGHAMVPSEAVSLPGGGVTVGAGLYTPSSFRFVATGIDLHATPFPLKNLDCTICAP
jgi:hypothetical protein